MSKAVQLELLNIVQHLCTITSLYVQQRIFIKLYHLIISLLYIYHLNITHTKSDVGKFSVGNQVIL